MRQVAVNTLRVMTPNIVLWIYIALLVAGGLMGFLKAKSKMSLIMSLAFALPLTLCALDILKVSYLADALIGVLLVFSECASSRAANSCRAA